MQALKISTRVRRASFSSQPLFGKTNKSYRTHIRYIGHQHNINLFTSIQHRPYGSGDSLAQPAQKLSTKTFIPSVQHHPGGQNPEEESTTGSNDQESPDDEDAIFDREFATMTIEDFSEVYLDDPDVKAKIQGVLNDYEFAKYNTMGRVPSKLEVKDMRMLITEGGNPHMQEKIFHFLFKREMDKRATLKRKLRERETIRLRRESKQAEFEAKSGRRSGLLTERDEIMYGLWHNSLFCRIPDNRLKFGMSTSRLINAALFGRKLIFDFGFEDYMSPWTYRNAIDQIQEAYGMNRFQYADPFDIWFCNLKRGSMGEQYCSEKAMKNLYDGSMITVKEDCFTNHFDKSRLVYLSPNAREPLSKIHKTDDIYIIGVFNDKGNSQPVSQRKALKLGIRTKSLPIDNNIVWQGPSKNLCVNHVTGILLEVMANGGDWKAAMIKHIPSRKIKPLEIIKEEEERRVMKIKFRKKKASFSLRDDLE